MTTGGDVATIDDLPAVRTGRIESTELPGAIDDLPPITQRPYPLPLVRWRVTQVLVAMIGVQLAVVAALLALDAVEPTDAKELLTVVAVPLYPLLGSVVAFYFTTRRSGFRNELVEQLPDLPAELDELARRLEREIAATRSDVERIGDVTRWTAGAAAAGVVILSLWSVYAAHHARSHPS